MATCEFKDEMFWTPGQAVKSGDGKCEFAKGLMQLFQLTGIASQRLGSLLIIATWHYTFETSS